MESFCQLLIFPCQRTSVRIKVKFHLHNSVLKLKSYLPSNYHFSLIKLKTIFLLNILHYSSCATLFSFVAQIVVIVSIVLDNVVERAFCSRFSLCSTLLVMKVYQRQIFFLWSLNVDVQFT